MENGANATGPQDIYFKGHVNLNMDVTWSTFLKDYVPVPPPPPKLINPCINESFAASKMKWCDHTLGVDERGYMKAQKEDLESKSSKKGTLSYDLDARLIEVGLETLADVALKQFLETF